MRTILRNKAGGRERSILVDTWKYPEIKPERSLAKPILAGILLVFALLVWLL